MAGDRKRDRLAPIFAVAGVLICAHYIWTVQKIEDRADADRERTACQARYNAAFTGQILARAAIAEEASRADLAAGQAQLAKDDAVDGLLIGFAQLALAASPDGTQTPEEQAAGRARSTELFAGYVTARESAKAAQTSATEAQAAAVRSREEHPLPPIPDC